MSDLHRPILRIGVKAAAATEASRLLTAAGAVPAAGGHALGPAYMATAAGGRAVVTALGTATGISGAAIGLGAALMADGAGKLVPWTATHTVVARALEAATAVDQEIEILVVPN